MSTTTQSLRTADPKDLRILITPEYLAGRKAREDGLDLGANPYPMSELDERMTWFLGFYDFAHGVSVERRAA